jgi:type VI secretion system secreted protein VgrG
VAIDSTHLHQIFFVNEAVGIGDARVAGMRSTEGLSRSYVLDVDVDLLGVEVEPRAFVQKPASIVVMHVGRGEVLRRYGGVVMRVKERVTRAAAQRVRFTLESPLAPLRLSRDRRIYQDLTTKDIVASVLEESGIPSSFVSFRLQGSYAKREVCMQFGEDNLSFVERLLEEDGIFYFFEHAEDGTHVVFADSSSAYAATASMEQIPFVDASGLTSEQAIDGVHVREEMRPAKVVLRDHDFKRPALDLEATAQADAPGGATFFEYPGGYVDPAEGARLARLRLDAFAAEAQVVRGTGTVFSLAPGHTFTLSGAPDPALDRAWVVRDLAQVWKDEAGTVSFTNHFRLLPTDAKFHAPARTPRPTVPGPQLARVTGPAGEEIHTDSFGRVKVHFPWDRRSKCDDKSSCWVRVGQMHTSGSVAIPRVGWEVIVDFEDGDPDRPIVLGRLYNGRFPPNYPLPANKTISSLSSSSSPGGDGHNEIRMQDGGGGEQLHVHAQKDMNVHVANNKTEKVATNASTDVKVNHALDVGANDSLKVGAKRELNVGAAQTWSVGGSRTKTVSRDEKIVVKGSRTLTIGGSHTTMTPMSVETTTPANLTETIGGSAIEAAAMQLGTTVAGAASITVGGSQIEAVASGKNEMTRGAKATTIGGALLNVSGADVAFSVGGAKATTVGGVWAATAGGDVELSSEGSLNINVGGAVAMNAAKVVLKVGGSTVTVAMGAVVLKSGEIKLIATGPQPELAPMVEDK